MQISISPVTHKVNFKLTAGRIMSWLWLGQKVIRLPLWWIFLDYRLHCFWLLNFHLVWASGECLFFLIPALNYYMSLHLARNTNISTCLDRHAKIHKGEHYESLTALLVVNWRVCVCMSICGCFLCLSVSLYKASRQSLCQQAQKQSTCTWSFLKLNAPT